MSNNKSKERLFLGVGLIDVDYQLTKYQCNEGKKKRIWVCPYVDRWKSMLFRCYSGIKPTYEDCYVCDEWLVFSNFKSWMEKQDWKGKHIDKDYIFKGNRIYSPDTCFFITQITNNFMLGNESRRGGMIGAWFDKKRGIYEAKVRNPITKKREFLGRFINEIDAHLAWKKRKHEIALILAEKQDHLAVKNRLLTEYKG